MEMAVGIEAIRHRADGREPKVPLSCPHKGFLQLLHLLPAGLYVYR